MCKTSQTVLFTTSALLQLSTAMPADPTITTAAVLPRQNANNFIGYAETNGTWNSYDCNPGLTWSQGPQYAQCCPNSVTKCYAATACIAGSQIYTYPDRSSATTIACTEDFGDAAISICNTNYIFENMLDSFPQTYIGCGTASDQWSFYRNMPATSSEFATAQPPSSTQAEPTQSAAAAISESKARIAGAVVGPVLGVALVSLGIWFLLRRRRRKTLVSQHGTAPPFVASSPGYYDQPGQLNHYVQQGYSPAPQYGFQSAYATTANSPPSGQYKDTNGAVELGSDSVGEVSVTPMSPVQDHGLPCPAAELSGGDVHSHNESISGGKGTVPGAHSKHG